MKATVEPLPLVPATWITGGSCRSGWPSAPRMRHMRSSDRSMRLGCRASSRARIASTWVMLARTGFTGLPAFAGNDAERVDSTSTEHARSRLGRRRERGKFRYGRRGRRGRGGGRLGEDAAQRRDGGAQLVAMHHHVDHAVLFEVFGFLESLRQLLANGLFD